MPSLQERQEQTGRFACTIGEWPFGFLNNFPSYDVIKEQQFEALKQIAFMNVRKTAGAGDVPA